MAKKRKKGGLVFIGNKWGPRRAKPRSVKPRARARLAKPGDTGPGPLVKAGDAAAASPEAARGAPTAERS
jgi:hypothetical protein